MLGEKYLAKGALGGSVWTINNLLCAVGCVSNVNGKVEHYSAHLVTSVTFGYFYHVGYLAWLVWLSRLDWFGYSKKVGKPFGGDAPI